MHIQGCYPRIASGTRVTEAIVLAGANESSQGIFYRETWTAQENFSYVLKSILSTDESSVFEIIFARKIQNNYFILFEIDCRQTFLPNLVIYAYALT